ncbi:LPXTG cell wall anchor domain-containing protein, partial [Paenibacillus amylolyticus]
DYTHYIIIGAVLFVALYFGLKYFKKKKAAR